MTWRFWRHTRDVLTLAEQRHALSRLLALEVKNHPQQTPKYIPGMERPDPRKFAPMNRPKLRRWSA